MGDAGRIDIAALGFEHDAADAGEIDQRVQPFGLGPADLVEIHPVISGLCRLKPQLVFPCLGLGKIKRSGLEDTTALSGFGLQFLIKPHGIVLKAADIGAVMQPVDIGCRMPCAAGGQL